MLEIFTAIGVFTVVVIGGYLLVGFGIEMIKNNSAVSRYEFKLQETKINKLQDRLNYPTHERNDELEQWIRNLSNEELFKCIEHQQLAKNYEKQIKKRRKKK